MGLNCPQCKGEPILYQVTYKCKSGHTWQENVVPAKIEDVPLERSGMKMPFGKYRGEYIDDIPLDYIEWCLGNIDNLRDSLKEEMERQVIMKKGGGAVVKKEGKISGTKFHYGPKNPEE